VEDARGYKRATISPTHRRLTCCTYGASHSRFQLIVRDHGRLNKCWIRAFKAAARVRIPLGTQVRADSDKVKRFVLLRGMYNMS
jgi:hypothetical protein